MSSCDIMDFIDVDILVSLFFKRISPNCNGINEHWQMVKNKSSQGFFLEKGMVLIGISFFSP